MKQVNERERTSLSLWSSSAQASLLTPAGYSVNLKQKKKKKQDEFDIFGLYSDFSWNCKGALIALSFAPLLPVTRYCSFLGFLKFS